MKNKEKMYNMHYDEETDYLEISFGEPAEEGTTEEIEEGVFVTRDLRTMEIRDIGILDFRAHAIVLKQLLRRVGKHLPFEVTC